MKLKRLFPLLLALLGAALPAFAQAPTARLGELGERPVVDARGAKIADIYDVVVDTEEGRAAYLVVSVGMKVIPIAIPSTELGFTADKVELTMDRARLESAPALDMSALGPRYKRGRDIVGGKLKDQKGATIAAVKDLVINLTDGQIANVVVEFDPKAWDQKGWVALPRSSVRHDGADFVATFSLDDMRPASQAAAEARAREIARAKAVSVDRDERMSQLVGRKLVDPQGKALGDIADFAIDPATGRIPYVMVNAGGSPLALALPSADIKRAGDEIVLAAGAAALAPPPTGASAKRASEVMKRALVDFRGKEVGRLRDLVVNLGTGKVHYAVAEFDAAWVQGGHLVTVRLPKDDMKVELNALMGAMLFPPNGWPDLNNEQYLANIDNYLKTH